MTVTNEREGLLGRAARVVGDLDHPFYAEERQRDVWNEASAVGVQALLWGVLVLACAMTWIGGGPLFPWALALLAVAGVSTWLMLAYASRQGVTGFESVRVFRPRTFVVFALYLATFVGAAVRGGFSWDASSVAGAVVGLVIAAAVGALTAVGMRARRDSGDAPDAAPEDGT